MNIGIDIDDTLTETSEFLMPYVAEYFSLDIGYLKKNNICYNNLPKEYKEKEVEFGKSTFGRVLLDVKLKQNAKEIIDKLREEGNKIIIITARDKTIYDEPFEFTSKQLEKLGIKYDKLVCSFDKRQICINEKIEYFVDDCIENLNKVEDVVDKVLLFNSNTNMEEDNHFTRVNSWRDVYKHISDYKNKQGEIWNKLYNEAKKVLNPRQVSNNVEAGGVSAAIVTKNGDIYKGVCIDTACSLGMCAERNAISTMITFGENEITHLICIGQNSEIMMPCGACRELLLQICENNKKTKIMTSLENYEYVELEDLLPKWWN